ncbi:hypothetical protein TNCV_1090771 [Trichonephila clavipes]|uniref:Uncharacterized protein n=1 Tax=Trichonephila clavipes TaxID=2585209 RepID=A0A8X6VQ77_TRICX|nr:hypothetical protein TNCV_1090771 [Trichonephila clavipes]
MGGKVWRVEGSFEGMGRLEVLFRSRPGLKIRIRIILMAKYYFGTYSPKKQEISNCMLTDKSGETALLCDGRCPCVGLGLP